MTNREKLRNMTDEELAEYLDWDKILDDVCSEEDICKLCIGCRNRVTIWLKEEVKENPKQISMFDREEQQ